MFFSGNKLGETMVQSDSGNDFEKVEIRVRRIVDVEVFPLARKPAYILQVGIFEKIGIRKSSSQVTHLSAPLDLIGKQVVAVINFPPKQIGPLRSECLVTGFLNKAGEVVLCVLDKPVPLGAKLL